MNFTLIDYVWIMLFPSKPCVLHSLSKSCYFNLNHVNHVNKILIMCLQSKYREIWPSASTRRGRFWKVHGYKMCRPQFWFNMDVQFNVHNAQRIQIRKGHWIKFLLRCFGTRELKMFQRSNSWWIGPKVMSESNRVQVQIIQNKIITSLDGWQFITQPVQPAFCCVLRSFLLLC